MGDENDGDKERPLPFSHRPCKKSETRQQRHVITFRVNTAIRDAIDLAASEARLKRGSFIRTTLVKVSSMATRRQPRFEEAALRPYYVELRHWGGNLNQIAYAGHLGQDASAALLEIKDSILKTLSAMRRVMGMEE